MNIADKPEQIDLLWRAVAEHVDDIALQWEITTLAVICGLNAESYRERRRTRQLFSRIAAETTP